MKFFTKSESIALGIIFLVLIAISVPNFIVSLRRARDQVRKDDMGALIYSIGLYFADIRLFPPSVDGKIVDCNGPCEWGQGAISGQVGDVTKVYMPLLPRDPNFNKGTTYVYLSDGHKMQIFVALENKDDDEYDPSIVARNIMCGNVVCNAGRNYGCINSMTLAACEEIELKK